MIEEEIWMPVKGFEGKYEVSHFGRVRSLPRSHVMECKFIAAQDNGVRLTVSLWKNNKGAALRVHKLVLEAFNCDMPEGLECCHYDGDHTNNHISNLRWDTHSSNMRDAVKHGTFNRARGERSGKAKLKEADVINIRKLLNDGIYATRIAEMYKMENMSIYAIKNGHTWKHVPVTA